MEKKSVLVCDKNKFFLKMFKKSFNEEFEFIDNSFITKSKLRSQDFNQFVFVVYNKMELIEFLKLYKEGSNFLVCVFNRQLYLDLSFLEEINDLTLLDGSKIKKEIILDLKLNLKKTLNLRQQVADKKNTKSNVLYQTQFYNSLKSLIISSVA